MDIRDFEQKKEIIKYFFFKNKRNRNPELINISIVRSIINILQNNLTPSINIFIALFLLQAFSIMKLSATDSPEVKFDTVRVESNKELIESRLNSSSVTRISQDVIKNLGANRVSEIMGLVPGIYVKDYGGEGGMKTISLRGTGAPQTSVLLNGIPLNFAQNGTIDLSTFPVNLFNSITIFRGGNSALSGGNAQAGSINFGIQKLADIKSKFALKYGSFNYFGINGLTPVSLLSNKIIFGAEYDRSSGNYPFNFNEFGNIENKERNNSDYSSLHIYTLIPLSGKSEENITVLYKNIDRGTPGAVVQNNVQSSDAQLKEEEILALTNKNISIFGNDIFWSGMVRVNKQNYSSSDITKYLPKGNITYFSKDFYSDFKSDFNIADEKVESDLYLSYSSLNSDELEKSLYGFADKFSGGINFNWNYKIIARSNLQISTQLAAGTQYSSRSGWILSPFAGFTVISTELNSILKLLYSYNFREPSFNELYYLNYGNSDLKPERSHTFNSSLTIVPLDWVTLDFSGYYSIYRDLISSVPHSPISFSAENIDKSLNYGFESTVSINPIEKLKIDFNYTRQFAIDNNENSYNYKKTIPYVPEEIISGLIFYAPGNFLTGADLTHSSFRYATADNSPLNFLPAYTTVNIFTAYNFIFGDYNLRLRFDLKNIFDCEYSLVLNYPLLGRSFYLSISTEI